MHSHRLFTSCTAPLLTAAAWAGFMMCTGQLKAQESGYDSGAVGIPASLHGQVVTATGQPLSDVRIELRSMTGRTISSTWAGISGLFYISNLESGVYEVVATSGVDQSVERVNIPSLETQLTVQIGSSRPSNHTDGTVSVTGLAVPSGARKAYEKAARLLQKNDMAGAWNQLTIALQMWPKYAEALTLRGVLKLQSNGLQDAMKDFAAALELDQGYPLAYIGLAAGYNLTGRFDDALSILNQARSLKMQSWQVRYETSKALLGKKIFDRALQEASQAGRLLGHDLPSINIVKAKAYIGLKNTNSATAELQRLLQKENSGPEADESRALLASMGTNLPK
jgi:hypothetical protein